ncbi:MAG: type I methionyl aminopeptidase [Proteobacteria bacterium]|nr:type I methionyl aminopeptidase [Pseudomonadota bacterium]
MDKRGQRLDKTQRNQPCWCGSGKKYKRCHLKTDLSGETNSNIVTARNRHPSVDKDFIEGMEAACKLAKRTLDMVEERITAGITTNQIDDWVHQYTLDNNATPATLNYNGFPKSVCTSFNDVICHGIPDDTIIKEGDIINVDVTSILDGYFGDTNRTFMIGNCSTEAQKITRIAKECLDLGIEAVKPYGFIGDIGAAIQEYAHSMGCSVVEKFVGHGIGRKFHQEPQVPHFGRKGLGIRILPGMTFTIEPMINLGKKGVRILNDGWTAKTVDGSLSAQFEHTILVTETDKRVLTR